jgi:hypothetical protein
MGMNIKPNHPVLVSLTGLVGVLGIARFCDAVMQFIQYQNAQTFSLSHVIFWAFALIALLMAASWLLVAWQVLIRAPGNIWVSVVFLLAGLFIITYPALIFMPALCCWLPNIEAIQGGPTMYLYSTGGFAAIVGLAGLVWRRRKV